MNTTSDTPETDAHQTQEDMAHNWLWREFARKLERERNHLRDVIENIRACNNAPMADLGPWDFMTAAKEPTKKNHENPAPPQLPPVGNRFGPTIGQDL